MVTAKVIPAPSVNQKMDSELSVLRLAQQPYRVHAVLLNSVILVVYRSCSDPSLLLMMGVVIIPSSVIIVTNLVDGFSLDEWLFAEK